MYGIYNASSQTHLEVAWVWKGCMRDLVQSPGGRIFQSGHAALMTYLQCCWCSKWSTQKRIVKCFTLKV